MVYLYESLQLQGIHVQVVVSSRLLIHNVKQRSQCVITSHAQTQLRNAPAWNPAIQRGIACLHSHSIIPVTSRGSRQCLATLPRQVAVIPLGPNLQLLTVWQPRYYVFSPLPLWGQSDPVWKADLVRPCSRD